jgi:hypothetical protein
MVVSVNVPEDVYEKAAEIARLQQVTVAEVIASACAEHVAAWDRLRQRAARGSREKFLAVMAKAPNVAPEECDRFQQ